MRALTFTGVLLADDELQLEPGFVVDGDVPGGQGELTVEALARDGQAIAVTQLPLVTPCGYPTRDPAEHPPRMAVGLVEFPEKADGLRVTLDGRTLLERTAPPGPREPTVEWPGALDPGPVSVRWRLPQRGALSSLGYSNDGGETWTPLSLPTGESSITFDAHLLPGGEHCLLELAVTDGVHTTRVRSAEYAVAPKGWTLSILSPADGASLSSREPVLLAAQGHHLEQRRAGSEEIAWTSSLDGGLGTGTQVMSTLRPGAHTITATMTGVWAQVQVSVGT